MQDGLLKWAVDCFASIVLSVGILQREQNKVCVFHVKFIIYVVVIYILSLTLSSVGL